MNASNFDRCLCNQPSLTLRSGQGLITALVHKAPLLRSAKRHPKVMSLGHPASTLSQQHEAAPSTHAVQLLRAHNKRDDMAKPETHMHD